MIAEHRHLVEQGAKLVELRLDYINGEVNLRRLLVDRPSPVVVTCRRERDGEEGITHGTLRWWWFACTARRSAGNVKHPLNDAQLATPA